MKALNTRKYFFFCLICFILNVTNTISIDKYPIEIPFTSSELDILFIEDKNDKYNCSEWIPSLLNPFLLVNSQSILDNDLNLGQFQISIPFIPKSFQIGFYSITIMEKYNLISAKERFGTNFNGCYFGLLHKIGDYSESMNESMISLNKLKENIIIDKRIFSFDKWNLERNKIQTNFYYGDSHDIFDSKNNDGIIANCKTNGVNKYWGCLFNEISFNNTSISLQNENKNNSELYNIYFSSENYNIIFPISFKKKFDELTNNSCNHDNTTTNISCTDFFNEENFASISLIDDNMEITIEIDNIKRFSLSDEEGGKNKSRISFHDDDYFILPLIMFKNFHIQFDAENNIISFYTTNRSILKLKNEKEDKKKGSSKGLKAFLIILLIIIILALCYFAFWFIKRRRNQVEKNINKYNKFEDEENFQNMNEKRVF